MTDSLLDIWGMRKRGKRDSARHSERIKKAIKENLKDLVTDASIISSDGKKKIKIPVKYLDSYRFKHGENKNKQGVGQGDKDHKPGDAIAHDGTGRKGQGQGKPGEDPGEDLYEEEVTLEEIVEMMLEDLGLPWLEKKDSAVEIETEEIQFTDISECGPLSNVDKKRTVYQNMKRNAAKNGKPEIKKIHPEDLRYKIWENKIEYHSNAAVYFLMDRSGSMDDDKKYIAKSFFFWLAHFCKTKYNNVELIFIAHDTQAKIVPEENFFTITNSGGTMCSSAFQLALEHIEANHPPESWNNYVFSFSDGDNWQSDNEKCMKIVENLLDVCTAVGYGEIDTDSFRGWGGSWGWSTLHEEFQKNIDHPRFIAAIIKQKEDIYSCLREFLGIEREKKK
jgi:sporulation protein YhbH